MQEFAEPALSPAATTGSLVSAVIANAAAAPDKVALALRSGAGWSTMSSTAFLADVQAVARGLMAAGVGPGDRVGIMSRTRYEWTLVDYAIWYAGGVGVPIYETSSAEQVEWILGDSGAVAVFLEGAKHRDLLGEVRDRLPGVQHAWVFDEGALDELRALGAGVDPAELEARREAVTPEDVATIIYTSGTTGRPKGCTLTHGNFMFEVTTVIEGMPELFSVEGSSTLLFLPLAHVFGRVIQVACLQAGITLAHSSDITSLVPDLGSFQPTFLLSVPRVFEKVFNSAQQRATADGKGRIFDAAAGTAIAYSRALDAGGPSLVLKAKHALFDRLVYGKLRAAMGGRVQWAVSGGAPLGERLGHFFRGIGITILEGYGLTETSAASTLNRPEKVKIGTVGKPIPGTAARIADDGEILLRGPHIFQGYWRNDTATAEAFAGEGWFRSGDIGEIDADGYVRITGRKKELIVTAGGKNVAPAVLEDRLRSHALVSQCMVVGDNQPFIAALITLDTDSLPGWLRAHDRPESTPVADLVDDPAILADLQAAVDQANKAVSHAEAIKKFRVLSVDWTEEGGQLTPSMKLKRGVVMDEFAAEVAALYA